MSHNKNVMIVAGEASGDIYGAHLVMAIKELDPRIEFFGLGGPEMERAGVRIIHQLSSLSVVGMTEIIPKSRYIFRALRELKRSLYVTPTDLLILIDYPGFNLHLAKKAHSLGIPVLYYIPPQVWAWREGRVKKIAKRVDRVAVILPFEKKFYRKHGLKAEYVGHPLLDISLPERDKEEIKKSLGINHNKTPILGLLPGSRDEEIKSLLPVMVGAAEIISQDYPDLCCILPLASTVKEDVVVPYIRNAKIDIKIERLDTKAILKIADLALIASGTATLEAAIMETPMVIAYKVSFLSYMLGRFLIKVSHIGLVNLVAGKAIVPELIQGKATALRLAEEASAILKNETLKIDMKKGLKLVHEQLGRGGAAKKAARIAGEMMGLY
ncbi:MAG: lipid-A-disaccharide synthase [Deltaproteobacteria bacterium]|nr:lipid-A-disaccharide synthase [Deltaproteobacteria bacterium]